MESNHAPGPWRIEHRRVVGSDFFHKYGMERNSIGVSSASFSDVVCEELGDLSLPVPTANARLIAAAPRMRSALELVLMWATNVNAVEESHVLAEVIESLRDSGMDDDSLTAASIALIHGAARATKQENIRE